MKSLGFLKKILKMSKGMERKSIISFFKQNPAKFGHLLGFEKLTDLHNEWIKDMVAGEGEEKTLQAHRGSYKTTCVSIALAIIIILYPNLRTLFLRKTDADVKEILRQVQRILIAPQTLVLVRGIWDIDIRLLTANTGEITTNLAQGNRGTPQLVGMGSGGSLTGKHFDRIFTDDIVNVQDRISKAERDRTKLIYQELQNIINRGGRIYNTGTPWHKDDAFMLMKNLECWNCYDTGIIAKEDIDRLRSRMTASLFAANYELRHIAADDVIFTTPQTGADPALVEQGICHIDAAYGGEDYTAFTICRKWGGKFYVFGKLWRKHVDDVEKEIIEYRKQFNAGIISVEDNGDKGYLGKALRRKGERVRIYHEKMNKFFKITSYLKAAWNDVVFVVGTDAEYINQICDYNENAEHDDAPDSLSSLIRQLWNQRNSDNEYIPLFM